MRPPCLPRAASRGDRVCVARGSMPYSAVTQPSPRAPQEGRHAVLDARGDEHARVAELHQHRSLGVPRVPARDPDRAQLVGCAAARISSPAPIHAPDQRTAAAVRVVRKRSGRLYGALPEVRERILETSRATLARLPDARDLQVREPSPESVGAEQQDVARLQRAATGETSSPEGRDRRRCSIRRSCASGAPPPASR